MLIGAAAVAVLCYGIWAFWKNQNDQQKSEMERRELFNKMKDGEPVKVIRMDFEK